MPILELKDVRYSYSPEKVVLRGVNCVFECGTLYALVGKSGAGKSTLLSLMAGLDLPESGQVLFDGTPTGDMDLDEYRRRKAAVIYQDFALFPMLTALENIEYPMELCHVDAKEARQQALALARRTGACLHYDAAKHLTCFSYRDETGAPHTVRFAGLRSWMERLRALEQAGVAALALRTPDPALCLLLHTQFRLR